MTKEEYQEERLRRLLAIYLNNEITSDQLQELKRCIQESDDVVIDNSTMQLLERSVSDHENFSSRTDTILRSILDKQPEKKVRIISWKRFTAAACIIVAIGVGLYYFMQENRKSSQLELAQQKDTGAEGTILELSDGTKINLSAINDGAITQATEGNVSMKSGQLYYKPSSTTELAYNMVKTPVGKQFMMVLPDGTKVWLNARSSIRYPTNFVDSVRMVTVDGELYFDVAQNSNKPFKVALMDHSAIEVLGTEFNVRAYNDAAATKATLINGSIKVVSENLRSIQSKMKQSVVLQPHEQVVLQDGVIVNVEKQVDIESIVAWKSGFFNFEDATLDEVMKDFEKWYGITVKYDGAIPAIKFFGKMSRTFSLMDALTTLKSYGVSYELKNGKDVIIYAE